MFVRLPLLDCPRRYFAALVDRLEVLEGSPSRRHPPAAIRQLRLSYRIPATNSLAFTVSISFG